MVNQELSEDLWITWLGVARARSFLAAMPNQTLESAVILNQRISASMLSDIAFVEVALRNITNELIQARFAEAKGEGHWLFADPEHLAKFGGTSLASRIGEARSRASLSKSEPSSDDLVAELSFGFWLNFLGKRYQAIHADLTSRLAGLKGRNIRPVPELASRVRVIRNRVAHHHRILHRDISRDWEDIKALAKVIDPRLEAFIASTSQTPRLLESAMQKAQAKPLPNPHEPR